MQKRPFKSYIIESCFQRDYKAIRSTMEFWILEKRVKLSSAYPVLVNYMNSMIFNMYYMYYMQPQHVYVYMC